MTPGSRARPSGKSKTGRDQVRFLRRVRGAAHAGRQPPDLSRRSSLGFIRLAAARAGCPRDSRRDAGATRTTMLNLQRSEVRCRTSARQALALQNLLQRVLQIRVLELISAGRKLGRFHALAGEKQFFAHLSEDDSDG